MKPLNILDKDLQKLEYQNITISILLANDGYCFSLKDTQTDRFLALQCTADDYTPDKVKQAADKLTETIWGEVKPLKVAHLLYAVKESMLVPPAFSEKQQLDTIMGFHFPVNPDIVNLKSEFDTYTLSFRVNDINHQAYIKHFAPKHTSHVMESLVKTALEYSQNQENDAVHVNVWNSYFDLIVVKDKKVQMVNSYQYHGSNDIVYFILNAYKQLMLDPKTCALMISGWIEKNDIAVIQLNKFVRNMFFETLNPHKKYSYHFQDTLPHYFIHFLNID